MAQTCPTCGREVLGHETLCRCGAAVVSSEGGDPPTRWRAEKVGWAVVAATGLFLLLLALGVALSLSGIWAPAPEVQHDYADAVRPALATIASVLAEDGLDVLPPDGIPTAGDLRVEGLLPSGIVDMHFGAKTGDPTNPPPRDEIDGTLRRALRAVDDSGVHCSGDVSFRCSTDYWSWEVWHGPDSLGTFAVNIHVHSSNPR